MNNQNKLPIPFVSAAEMEEYTIEKNLHYKKERKSPYAHFELIEETLKNEFDSVLFCFTGMHRDWGIANKDLHAYGVTDEGLVCARKTFSHKKIEVIPHSSIKDIREEKKLTKDKLIIETEEEEIQILVNSESLTFIVECLQKCLMENR